MPLFFFNFILNIILVRVVCYQEFTINIHQQIRASLTSFMDEKKVALHIVKVHSDALCELIPIVRIIGQILIYFPMNDVLLYATTVATIAATMRKFFIITYVGIV